MRLHTSFVLGYHGCCETIGGKIIGHQKKFTSSDKDYDWLGPGVYFWEADPLRAWEWADWKVKRGEISKPFVIGAVLDLGNCLDFLSRESLKLLKVAYENFSEAVKSSGYEELPENKKGRDADEDNILRYLDCAVIRHLHASVAATPNLPPFDSVRGLFNEGGELFPGSGFKAKTHVQISIVNMDCIKATFSCLRP